MRKTREQRVLPTSERFWTQLERYKENADERAHERRTRWSAKESLLRLQSVSHRINLRIDLRSYSIDQMYIRCKQVYMRNSLSEV